MNRNDSQLFEQLQTFLDEINVTNSSNDKKKVISEYPELLELLYYVYNPYKKYYIKSEQLEKHLGLCHDSYINDGTTLYELLDALHTRKITGHEAIENINYFIAGNEEYTHLINLIIDKDLKCGAGASIINKVFPGTIPEHKVSLADRYKPEMAIKMDWTKWGAMRKLDGVRCDIRIDNDSNAKFYSRTGHEFTTLGVIAEEIKKLGIKNLDLDGEVCLIDSNGNDNFQGLMKVIKKKDYVIENPKFIIFDILTTEEFDAKYSDVPFISRIERFNPDNNLYHDADTMSLIDIHTLNDQEDFEKFREGCINEGWEGSMLRRLDSPYKAKRTKDLLKVKSFHDAEYTVVDIETGPMQVLNKDTGLQEELEVMTNVLIQHQDSCFPDRSYQVSVGSGFKLDERKYYYEHPEELIGKEITVQYFEETRNQTGGASLRFPTVKKIWTEGKRTI